MMRTATSARSLDLKLRRRSMLSSIGCSRSALERSVQRVPFTRSRKFSNNHTTEMASHPGADRESQRKRQTSRRNEAMDNTRVFRMAFASVYPHYITKAEKKGRTKEEVHAIIQWLTGYDEKTLQQQIDKKVDFETFFTRAPRINPNVSKITGVICGYRVEEIEDKLMQQIRYLDKLVHELAKASGRCPPSILASSEAEQCGRARISCRQDHPDCRQTSVSTASPMLRRGQYGQYGLSGFGRGGSDNESPRRLPWSGSPKSLRAGRELRDH